MLRNEPVALSAALVAFVTSVIPLLQLFKLIDWSPEQQAAVLLVFDNLVILVGAYLARSRVTPV